MRRALAALAAAAGVSADRPAFEAFKREYQRAYASPTEEAHRFGVFEANLRAAAARDAEGHATHGVTKFSDWTPDEFKSLLGYRPIPGGVADEAVAPDAGDLPSKIDWSRKGMTTPVKDQGSCGSCWSFSATEQIESDFMLQKNVSLVLSPQEFVDCVTACQGCGGGDPTAAFKYAGSSHGEMLESDYKYTGSGGSCKYSKSKRVVDVLSYHSHSGEKAMQTHIGNRGPVSFCAMAESWQSYKGGILQSCGSGGGHCIQAVGYDTSGSIPYWIVRNSWGSDFGVDGGYIHIEMFKELCGIGTHGAFSTTAGDLHVNATRYHCNKVSRTCMPSVEGHSSAEKCAAACGAPSA